MELYFTLHSFRPLLLLQALIKDRFHWSTTNNALRALISHLGGCKSLAWIHVLIASTIFPSQTCGPVTVCVATNCNLNIHVIWHRIIYQTRELHKHRASMHWPQKLKTHALSTLQLLFTCHICCYHMIFILAQYLPVVWLIKYIEIHGLRYILISKCHKNTRLKTSRGYKHRCFRGALIPTIFKIFFLAFCTLTMFTY